MLVPMAKVEIIGPKGLFYDVMSLVHEQGRLHIEDMSKKIDQGEVPLDHMEVDVRQAKDLSGLDEMLVRLRAILKALERESDASDESRVKAEYARLNALDHEALSDRISQILDEVEDKASSLSDAHNDLEAEDSQLARYEPILKKIQPLAEQITTTGNYDSVALLFERRYKSAIEELRAELDKITHRHYELQATDVDEDTTAVIVVYAKQYADAVHKFLTLENVNQVRLPSGFDGMPFDTAFDEIRHRRSELPGELDAVRNELRGMSTKWRERLLAARDVLIDRIDEIQAIPKFGRTEYAFVITGWIPLSDLGTLRKMIEKSWKQDVIVEQIEVTEGEFKDTPVALKNPKAMEPFEKVMGFYGMPRYGTLDPTWMLFVFFPFFMGMIVGDIGYGVIMLGIILWLRARNKDNPGIKIATSILGPAATMVIAFGFLYGEFFGNLGFEYLGWIKEIDFFGMTLPFNRVELVYPFMFLALGVGVVHILLGIVLGIVNAIRTKNKNHLWEKSGILALLLGIGFAVALSMPMATQQFGKWAIGGQAAFALVALVGFVYAIRGGKIMGFVEILEAVSGMASYIRIMAVGLMGALFADAINGIVSEMSNAPVMGAIVALLLHSLNFIIAAFSPAIHAMRLNFLEFFGKFYETGGRVYEPFTKTGGE